jgi:hypothetical protein
VIVSAPASAALHVPVVSLAPSPASQDSPTSKTTAFKNVFDGLTLFDDLENGAGAEQQGAALPKSTAKKDPSADSSSGTEEAVVPQAPSGNLPKPSLMLQTAATLSLSTLGVGTEPIPTPTATKTQVTGNAVGTQLFETSPTAQTTAPSTSETSTAPVPKPVQKAAIQDVGLLVQAAQPETAPRADILPTGNANRTTAAAPQASGLQIRASEQAPQLSTNPAPQTPSVKAPVDVAAMASNFIATQTPQVSGPGSRASAPQTPSVKAPVDVNAMASDPIATQTALAVAPQTASVKAPVNNSSAMASNFVATQPPQVSSTATRAAAPQTPGVKTLVNNSSAVASNFIATQSPQASAPRIRASAPQTPSVKAGVNNNSAKASNFVTSQLPQASGPRIHASAPLSDPVATAVPARVIAPLNNSTPIAMSLPESSSPQVVVPPQPSQSIQLAPPAPRQQPEAPSALPAETPARTTTATGSIVPTPTLPPAAPEAVAAPTSLPAPPPAIREVMDRTSEASKPVLAEHEALAVTPAPKIPLLPEAENFAFALQMLGLDSTSSITTSETPVTPSEIPVAPTKGSVAQPQPSNSQQPAPPPVDQISSAPQRETPSSSPQAEPETEKSNAGVQNQPDLLKAPQTPEVIPHLNETTVFQAPEPGSLAATPEPTEAAHSNLPLAVQEAHFSAPEIPNTSASSEILLHLTGNGESSAAIRIADRAGSVNVSVHASDPVLRESLRSNLGELSTQLNAQGWKADVVKSAAAAVATHSESQQDSQANGQRGSQQQSSGGERQPQRDRRANGGQWQQELDQQITGGDAHPGGNG